MTLLNVKQSAEYKGAFQDVSADGAVGIKSGVAMITKATAAAVTIAAPTAGSDDGKVLHIRSTTAAAHTITNTTPGFNNLSTSGDVATLGGAIGDGLSLIAYNGIWWVLQNVNATLA